MGSDNEMHGMTPILTAADLAPMTEEQRAVINGHTLTQANGTCCGGGANPGGHEWNCEVLRKWNTSRLIGAKHPEPPTEAMLNDRGTGTGTLDGGRPVQVTLSGREYERYLDGALNEQLVAVPEEVDDLLPVILAVRHLLDAVDPNRDDHTIDTPMRAAKMWRDLLRGQNDDPRRYLEKTFSAPRDGGLIIQSGIEMTSVCAHHLLPFTGKATVAYRPSPGQDVVGLSKLTRVLQAYASRLQIQERIGAQVVEAIQDKLLPSGVMVVITAKHDCMRLRGVRDDGSETTTVAAAGMLTAQEVSFIQAAHLQKSN